MRKTRVTKVVAFILCCAIGLAGCGKEPSDEETEKTSNATIKFYSWGNETEIDLTRALVEEFNEMNVDGIKVEFTPIPSGDYETKVSNSLRGRNVPDVIIAGDGEIKNWIEQGGIAQLDEYAAKSETIHLESMWEDGVNRYRYDVEAHKGGTGNLYGIVRDYSPSVLYYNKDAMAAVGIDCISLSREESAATYGTEEAYFEKDGTLYFNNQIALDWDSFLALSQKLTSNTAAPVRNDKSITKYGLYAIYWFGFGWSVGGDCLEWVEDASLPTGGKYEFTLFDETKNYIVNENNTVTVNGRTYQAGEIVSYSDKAQLTAADQALCTELPSQMEAMQFFVDLSVKHGVSPKPDVSDSNSTYGLFSSQQCAMLIDTRYAVGIFRKTIGDSFDWDVAPLPVYKDGIAAGHSGSQSYCIPEKSTKKDAAWKFIEWMSADHAQSKYAEAGFIIPNTMELSASDTFLQPGQKPENAKIFVDAAYYQRSGDWGYLPSKAWINEWSIELNNNVLMGEMTLQELRDRHEEATQEIVDAYYEVKHE